MVDYSNKLLDLLEIVANDFQEEEDSKLAQEDVKRNRAHLKYLEYIFAFLSDETPK